MLTTNLKLCRASNACDTQYALLVQGLGPDWGDEQPIPLTLLLDLQAGPDWQALGNTLWALRAVPAEQAAHRDKVARLFAASRAESVLPIYEKHRPGCFAPRYAAQVACQFAHGEAAAEDLAAAEAAAWNAAWNAAWDAAEAAAWNAAWAAARDAAWNAAWDAAWAARDAAEAAAWAARDAAEAAAWNAAWDAAEAAAWNAAWDALRSLLEEEDGQPLHPSEAAAQLNLAHQEAQA